MRILVVCPFGGGTEYSGPITFLNRLFEPIAEQHEVTVLYGRRHQSDLGFGWAWESVPLMRFTNFNAVEQLLWALRSAIWIVLRADRYDIIHIHGLAVFNLLSALGSSRTPLSLLALSGNADLAPRSRIAGSKVIRRLRRRILGRAEVCWALSGEIADEFAASGVGQGAIRPIDNPVNYETIRSLVGAQDLRLNKRTLGFVGVLGERKGAELVLLATDQLRRTGWPDARAIFVGPFSDDTYRRSFEALINELNIGESITLTGYVDDVAPIMGAQMSVFVLPSSKEGLPGALAEAMASGLPSVVTDVGAMGTVVRDAQAGLVSERSSADIASCVEQIWADADVWRSYSDRAASYAAGRFDARTIADYVVVGFANAVQRG